MTYVKTAAGWLYLAVVIDLCTRMVVGWSMDGNMRAALVVDALKMAWHRGYVAWNAIFHPDRGSQYTSLLLAAAAAAIGVRLSAGLDGLLPRQRRGRGLLLDAWKRARLP